MTSIRSSSAFNDPQFGEVAANISQLFAPPSGADAAGWASAAATKGKEARLSEAFRRMTQPGVSRADQDQWGIAAGQFAPSSSYYSVDKTADTSMANNEADNVRALQQTLLAPLGRDQVRNVPPKISRAFGVPEQQSGVLEFDQGKQYYLPSGADGKSELINGPAKPLSKEQVEGQVLQGMTPEQQQAVVWGNTPIEQVLGPDGKPIITTRDKAVGAAPYDAPGTTGKKTNVIATLPNGADVAAFQGADGSWYNAQTQGKLPEDIRLREIPRPQGSNADLGVGRPTQNKIEQQLIDIAVTKDTANNLLNLIRTNPASQGAVGWLRGTAQNVIQVGGELGQFFGGKVAEVNKLIDEGVADVGLKAAFDPNIPAIEMMSNLLAFQYARTTTPGDRVSNEMIRASRQALGLEGLTENQQSAEARLTQAVKAIESQERILQQVYKTGIGGLPATTPGLNPKGKLKDQPGDMLLDALNAAPGSAPDAIPGTGDKPPPDAPPGTYRGQNKKWYVKKGNDIFEVQP